MEGIEDKLGQLLNDPNSMAQIMSMVQSLGLGAPPEEKEDTAPPPNDEMLRSVLQIMQQTQQDSPREEALLKALKPFLRQGRQKQMDKAMQLARMARLAGCAIRSFGQTGGLADV